MKKGKLGAILLALVLIIGLVCCVVCLEKIPAGYVGVVYNMNGGVDGEVLEQGWHLVAPTKKVTKYSIGIEQSYLTAEDKGDSPKDESFNIPMPIRSVFELRCLNGGCPEVNTSSIESGKSSPRVSRQSSI